MISWFARHQTAANLLMLAIAVLGLVTLPGLQRATFPEIKNQKVQVSAVYPGATSREVEDAVCRRLEDALDGTTDMEEIACEARESLATATATMLESADMSRFLDDVKSAVDGIDDFPEQVETPRIEELFRTERVISIAVTGPEDPVTLKAYAEDIKSRLMTLPEVAGITVNGFSDHLIRIEVPSWKMRQYGLSLPDLATAIQRNSYGAPSGRIEGGNEDLLLRFDEQRKSVDGFKDLIVVSGNSGAAIPLGAIARISNRFDRDEEKILFNGKRAALLDVEKTRNEDILRVHASVRDFVEKERLLAPRGITLELTQDMASVVQDRLNMLLRNGGQGLLLVFLVLWLFFSFRYSFWVAVGLPVSFLGALFLMPLMGITVNMISMVGLLIGIGLLMDDAIVIAENIAARLGQGDAPMAAAINGVSQVLPGIASSFATTVLVFGSLAFITGEIGQILRVMPVVLILVLTVSLLEAFLILPNHLGHSLVHMRATPVKGFRVSFERGFDQFRERVFGRWLDRALDYRYLTLGLVIMLLVLAAAMPASGMLKFVGFPDIEGDIVEARVLLPQGTPLARTEAVVARLEAALVRINQRLQPEQPEGQDLVRNTTVIFARNPDAYETGPHVARVVADLLGAEIRNTSLADFRQIWREETGPLADVISINFVEPVIGPGGRAIDLRLAGTDLQQLKSAAGELQAWLNGYRGVVDVTDDLRPGKREIRFLLKDTAGVLGLDANAIARQLQAAFQGITIDEFPLGSESYEVKLLLQEQDRDGPEDLDDLVIVTAAGAQVPLQVVAELEPVRGWARIQRINGQRTVTVQGDVDGRQANAQQLINLAQAQFMPGLLERYPGISYSIEGMNSETAKTGQSIVRNVLLGLFGVYILLSLQFRGYLAPLTVMIVIPTALIGVVFGHLAMGLDMTMPSIVGMASLFGVVVNDSILLVVFIRQARDRGASTVEAARQAGRARFRPILLTSVTTVAGLLPLLLEGSLQAQILIPLAASLAFGLTTATLTALLLVPAMYCILDDFNALGALHGEADEVPGKLVADQRG